MKTILAVLLLTISFNAQAKNPGESAQHCVDASSSNGKITFTNNCDEKVFVIWCGDLTYTKNDVGMGQRVGFIRILTILMLATIQPQILKDNIIMLLAKGLSASAMMVNTKITPTVVSAACRAKMSRVRSTLNA